MHIARDVTELIGRTPLVRLNRVTAGLAAEIVAKLEFRNPANSVKDRIGLAMIEAAEQRRAHRAGRTVLVEPTSGNTGIALAFVAAVKGYGCVLVMPDTMSLERRVVVRAFGARVVLTPGARGMLGAVDRAERARARDPARLHAAAVQQPGQSRRPPATTAEEIWRDTDGQVDAVVAGVGTGGTITGVAAALARAGARFRAVAVEPAGQPGARPAGGPGHISIQGIGAGFIPDVVDPTLIDDVIGVADEDAFDMARRLAREEGLLVGISSGAAVSRRRALRARPETRQAHRRHHPERRRALPRHRAVRAVPLRSQRRSRRSRPR